MLKCRTVALSVALTFILSATVAAQSLPFSVQRGIPEIEVLINDSIKASFVIDTGADHIYVDKTFARKHGLAENGTLPMRATTGVEGDAEAVSFRISSLSFAKVFERDLQVVAVDLYALIRDTTKGLPDGVLGYNFLKSFKVELAYGTNPTCRFHEKEYDPSDLPGFVSIPFELSRHLIIVEASINQNPKAKFILDTGSSYSLLSRDLAPAQSAEKERGYVRATVTLVEAAVQKDVSALLRDLSSLQRAANVELAGVVGTDFLRGKLVVLDYVNRKLHIADIQSH